MYKYPKISCYGCEPGDQRTATELGLPGFDQTVVFTLKLVMKEDYSPDKLKKRAKQVLLWMTGLDNEGDPEPNVEIECTREAKCGPWIDARLPLKESPISDGNCNED